MKIFVNYATENFFPAQRFSGEMAVQKGGFDLVIQDNPSTLGVDFTKANEDILSQPRGAGYWLWKPYCILRALKQAKNDDLVMYADSGSHFIRSADPLFKLLGLNDQDVIPFSLEHPEAHWTKRDAFVLMNCDDQGFEREPQRLASFILMRRSLKSISFFEEYLEYCCNQQILTDLENSCGLPNYSGFREHRHDQSVFSLLSKKHKLQSFRDPCQWGNSQTNNFINSSYPQIIEHTRQKSPKQARLAYKIKKLLLFS